MKRKRSVKRMEAAAKIIPFRQTDKRLLRKKRRDTISKAIPFSKMSENARQETMEALRDE